MANLRSKMPVAHAPSEHGTTIGSEIQVRGRIEGQEDLRIQGRVEGAIALTETLFVEASGVVRADVEARDVVISGIVIGNVRAEDSVTLNAGARLVGNITAPRLIISDGAAFSGEVEMTGTPPLRERSSRARAEATTPSTTAAGRASATSARRAAAPPRAPSPAASAARGSSAASAVSRSEAPARTPMADASSRRGANEEQTVVIRHTEVARDAAKTTAPVAKPTAAAAVADGDGKRPMPPQLAAALAARRAAASTKADQGSSGAKGPRPRVADRGRRRVNRR
jgi:cytoskeletal protein CcmA (bactofilin family)